MAAKLCHKIVKTLTAELTICFFLRVSEKHFNFWMLTDAGLNLTLECTNLEVAKLTVGIYWFVTYGVYNC